MNSPSIDKGTVDPGRSDLERFAGPVGMLGIEKMTPLLLTLVFR